MSYDDPWFVLSDKRRSQLLAKEERTDTDKKRERRGKKRRQAAKARSREQQERQLAAQPEQRRSAAGRRLAEAQLARAEKRGLVTRVGRAARRLTAAGECGAAGSREARPRHQGG